MKAGFVAIVGRPNVGKSTLLNRLVGRKLAIVTSRPQTTRNGILAVANRDNAQIVFYDTPGIHKPERELDRHMFQTAIQSLKGVDVALLLIDVGHADGASAGEDERVLKLVKDAGIPVVLGINKIDSRKKQEVLPLIERYRHKHDFVAIVPLSGLTGDNVDRLEEVLIAHLPEGERLYPEETLTELPERFFVAEIVREKILRLTRLEVPYATAVSVDAWDDSGELTRIEASILVDRDSQKLILVGRAGSMLKKIGTSARKDIERFLSRKVYLGLHVKVSADWRDNKRVLDELGI